MGDRRQVDRRSPEKGVIKIKFSDAILYLTIAMILILSLLINVVLIYKNNQYKKEIENYKTVYEEKRN